MNVFDIIGPVMIGPSSSHTAGAVRLGRVANKLMDGAMPERVDITLSGSFARTWRGHGTDRAILAGILGYHSWDAEIRDAREIAASRGLNYSFTEQDIPGAHPNTARIRFLLPGGAEGSVEGASIGGGNIRVSLVNGMRVDFSGDSHTVLILHRDRPGVIAAVTNLMRRSYAELNISSFHLSREERGGMAIMTIEMDSLPPDALIDDVRGLENVVNAILIRAL